MPKYLRISRSAVRRIAARYDAAQTGDHNRNRWAAADALSANAANSAGVRKALRERARYEAANNSYVAGMVRTLIDDTIGTGPRLQVDYGDEGLNEAVETSWRDWCDRVDLVDALRILRRAAAVDGEGFAILVTDADRIAEGVSLHVQCIEADQVSSGLMSPDAVDGVQVDRYGRPVAYKVLSSHPGDGVLGEVVRAIPASSVIHYFRRERPGQLRGVPEITAALPLFSQLRDYTVATLDAAKAAAYFVAVITGGAASADDEYEDLDTFELERNSVTKLPDGYSLGQVKAEQPTGTYVDFKRSLIQEAARSLSMPYNIAAGDSSGYNYASGRLDQQVYGKAISVERSQIEHRILRPIYAAWLREAGLADRSVAAADGRGIVWHWDGREHVDPVKEANAQGKRLENLTTTLADEYARQGRDWRDALAQRAREIELAKSLGLMPVVAE